MLYSQESISELGATFSQQGQKSGCGMEVSKDNVRPTRCVCICPSLNLTQWPLLPFCLPNLVQVLLLTNPSLVHD